MLIHPSDIRLRLSAPGASAGNTVGGTAGNSLGRFVATTEFVNATPHNLFREVTAGENAGGTVDYQCLFVHNAHPTNTLQWPRASITSQVAGGVNVAIGVDPTPATALASPSAQAAVIADKDTAPAGVTFGTAVVLGRIPAGKVKALWVRRTSVNAPARRHDGVTIVVTGSG